MKEKYTLTVTWTFEAEKAKDAKEKACEHIERLRMNDIEEWESTKVVFFNNAKQFKDKRLKW